MSTVITETSLQFSFSCAALSFLNTGYISIVGYKWESVPSFLMIWNVEDKNIPDCVLIGSGCSKDCVEKDSEAWPFVNNLVCCKNVGNESLSVYARCLFVVPIWNDLYCTGIIYLLKV